MFDIGMPELIMIFIVALIVIGPKQLPELARSLGKGLAELKKSFDGVKAQVTSEMEMDKEEKKKDDLLGPPAPPESATAENAGRPQLRSEAKRRERKRLQNDRA